MQRIKEINIKDIKINCENPRHNPTLFEEEAIKLLCLKNQKMIDLCESILSKSFYPQSIISVIPDGEKYIAIDGNRRLCALKLLNGFVNAPIGEKFTKLKNYLEDKSIDHKFVDCVVYQDEAEAADYIIEVHTSGSDIEKWNKIQQYKYKKRFTKKPIPGYEILVSNYEHPERISNPTTISRVFGNEEVKKLLGINQDGSLKDFKMLDYVKSIVEDIDKKKEDSRSLNSSNNIIDYVTKKLTQSNTKNDKSNKDKASSGPKVNDEVKSKKTTQLKDKKNNTRTKQQFKTDLTMISRSCSYLSEYPKLNLVIEELTTLRIDTFSYASAILYRSLLQLSLNYYSLKSDWDKFNNENLEASLNSVNHFIFGNKGVKPNKGVHSQIADVLNRNGKFIQIINGYTHDLNVEFNKTLILDYRNTFKPLLDHIYGFKTEV